MLTWFELYPDSCIVLNLFDHLTASANNHAHGVTRYRHLTNHRAALASRSSCARTNEYEESLYYAEPPRV